MNEDGIDSRTRCRREVRKLRAGLVGAIGEHGRDFPLEEVRVDPLSAHEGYCSEITFEKEAALRDLGSSELLG